jgi:hypothetical protein
MPQIYLKNNVFEGTAIIETNGATATHSYGGNTFQDSVEFINSGSAVASYSESAANTYQSYVKLTNEGSSDMIFNYGATETVSGDLTLINASSANDGKIYVCYSSSASLTVSGFTKIYNAGAGTDKNVFLGYNGDLTLNDTLGIQNISTASGDSKVYVAYNSDSEVEVNENIYLECTNTSTQGIYFGYANGTTTLASGKTINFTAGGFSAQALYLNKFTQNGTTAQNLTLSSGATLKLNETSWGGDVAFSAPQLLLSANTFSGDAEFTKTGSGDNSCNGGNTFNGETSITNSGSGNLYLAASNGNDYNGNLSVTVSGTGSVIPAYNASSTLSGNLTVDISVDLNIGNGASSLFTFDGSSAQSINNAGSGSYKIIFSRLKINKSSGDLTLNNPVLVGTNLDLTAGNIISSSTYLLAMGDNSTVSNVSSSSYVNGPVKKLGDDAFVFPVGDDGYYEAIEISAPASTTDAFTAQYHASSHSNTSSYNTPLEGVSTVEYWELDRTSGSSNVDVTLHWSDGSRSGINAIGDITVAHYDGSTWEDKGQDSYTGTYSGPGSITANSVSTFSPFTFGTLDADNSSLPVTILNYDIVKNDNTVDINWSTSSEINNDYFTVERSQNMIDAEEIAVIDGAGNSNILRNYSFTDEKPLNGVSYYRLVQVDFDGKRTEYEWKEVVFKNNNTDISVYPNPAPEGKATLKLNGLNGITEISVFNGIGQIIFSETVYIQNKEYYYPVNLHQSKGMYYIKIYNNNSLYIKKIEVK